MRFKLTPKFILFSVLCICLTSEELWLENALASNTGRIVFTSRRDRNNEIYVMDADGGNQENLTNHPAYDATPDWSPDGRKIVFVSTRDGGVSQIHIMNADGKNVIRLTDGQGGKRDPAWSPNGRKIAFTVSADLINNWVHHIAVMDADGRNREKLEDQASEPSWSPDGKQIAFVSSRDDRMTHEIYVIDADGQGMKRVTHDIVGQHRPAFSPDGRRIAYMAEHEGFSHLYVVGADGKNRVRLTHNEENHWAPAWSPDGQVIAYYVWDGILEGKLHGTIHLMAADGRYIRQLSDGRNARDYQPDINPLGLAVSPAFNKSTTWGSLKKLASDLRESARLPYELRILTTRIIQRRFWFL